MNKIIVNVKTNEMDDMIINGLAQELGFVCKRYWFNAWTWYKTIDNVDNLNMMDYKVEIIGDILFIFKKSAVSSRAMRFDIADPQLINNISKAIK